MTPLQDFDARTWRRIFLSMLRYQPIPADIAFGYNRMEDIDDQIKAVYLKIKEHETSKEAFWDGLMETFSELIPAGHNRIDNTKEHEDIFLLINVISFVQPQPTEIGNHFNTLFSKVNDRCLLGVMYNEANLHFKLLSALIAFGDRTKTRHYLKKCIEATDHNDKPISKYPIFYEIVLRYYLRFSPEEYDNILLNILPAFNNKENAVSACRALIDYAVSTSFKPLFDFLKANYNQHRFGDNLTTQYRYLCECLHTWTGNRPHLENRYKSFKEVRDSMQQILEGYNPFEVVHENTSSVLEMNLRNDFEEIMKGIAA